MLVEKILSSYIGCDVVSEHKFHPIRKWRFDYAIVDKKIAIEQEGAVWVQGRHTRGSGFVKDMEKYNEATAMGWRILRFQPKELTELKSLEIIKRTCKLGEDLNLIK